jgi:hypothetical protein
MIIPFPLSRRLYLVERVARAMASMDAIAADRHLIRQLELHQDVLQQLGVDQTLINEALVALAYAVRAQLWHEVLSRPGGAA